MPHVAFVPFSGLRIGESEMLEFGMRLPGLSDRAEALSGLPSLGLLTLAGMLSEEWTCSYHPSDAADDLVAEVLATQPTLVAVSALTASVLEAYEFCERIRAEGVPTVIGGLHATAMPEEAARHSTSVCVKDGEASWSQILADVGAGKMQAIYRPTKPANLLHSVMPRFDLVGERKVPRWTVQTQRGCPWACEFCGASRLLGPPRYKPAERVASELAAIRELDDSPWVELADDNTLAGREDPELLLQNIGAAGIRYFTESDWRIAQQPDIVKRLADSGCVQVLVGIESLGFQYPGMGRKEAEPTRMLEAIEVIQDAGIVVNGCFIVGATDETDASLDRLIDFIDQSPLAEVQLTLQTPFPGTALYRRMHKQGRLRTDRDWSHYTLFDVVFHPEKMKASELEDGFRRVMSSVFNAGSADRRSALRRSIWSKHPRFGRRENA